MRNLKEVRPLLTAIYCINRTGSKDEDIEKILDYAFAYVWNKDDDDCSEFGTVALSSFGGGIRRIG